MEAGGPDSTSRSLCTIKRAGQDRRTTALWVQDAWRFASQYKLTLGGRLENWRAYDGYNLNDNCYEQRRHHLDQQHGAANAGLEAVQALFTESGAGL